MATKYYAVVCGVTPGIYTDWPTTQRMVKGYPGAIFKSFPTRAQAQAFIERSTAINKPVEEPHMLPLADKTIIYTDGSFTNSECGFGVVIITSSGDKLTAYGKVPVTVTNDNPTNNIAELYAIYVALSLVKGDIILYSDSNYAISCLTSYIHDWQVSGWKGVANRNLIEGTYRLMTGRNVTFQHVDAHSDIELNEEADQLANKGREQEEELVVIKNDARIL